MGQEPLDGFLDTAGYASLAARGGKLGISRHLLISLRNRAVLAAVR